jgi:hypothetical protein
MPPSRLTLLQMRVLDALEGMTGDWALSGGAALAGFHTATAQPGTWISSGARGRNSVTHARKFSGDCEGTGSK